jgi:membrane protein required for colicin V production
MELSAGRYWGKYPPAEYVIMNLSDFLHYLETMSGNIHFNYLDIVFFIIIAAFSIFGLVRGFVKGIVSIIAVVLGLYIAIHWYGEAARYLTGFKDQDLQDILGFMIVFIGVSLILGLLGKLLSLALGDIELGCIDHVLGLVFGFIKGVVVVCVILLVLASFLPPSNKVLAKSQLTPTIISLTKTIAASAPSSLKEQFTVKFDVFKKVWCQGSVIDTLVKDMWGQHAATSTTTIIPD